MSCVYLGGSGGLVVLLSRSPRSTSSPSAPPSGCSSALVSPVSHRSRASSLIWNKSIKIIKKKTGVDSGCKCKRAPAGTRACSGGSPYGCRHRGGDTPHCGRSGGRGRRRCSGACRRRGGGGPERRSNSRRRTGPGQRQRPPCVAEHAQAETGGEQAVLCSLGSWSPSASSGSTKVLPPFCMSMASACGLPVSVPRARIWGK